MNNQNKHPKEKLYALVNKLAQLTKWHATECRKFTDEEATLLKPEVEVVRGKYGYSMKFTNVESGEASYLPLLRCEDTTKKCFDIHELYYVKLQRHNSDTLYRISTTPVEIISDEKIYAEKILQEITKEKDRLASLGVKVTFFDTCIPY